MGVGQQRQQDSLDSSAAQPAQQVGCLIPSPLSNPSSSWTYLIPHPGLPLVLPTLHSSIGRTCADPLCVPVPPPRWVYDLCLVVFLSSLSPPPPRVSISPHLPSMFQFGSSCLALQDRSRRTLEELPDGSWLVSRDRVKEIFRDRQLPEFLKVNDDGQLVIAKSTLKKFEEARRSISEKILRPAFSQGAVYVPLPSLEEISSRPVDCLIQGLFLPSQPHMKNHNDCRTVKVIGEKLGRVAGQEKIQFIDIANL